MKTLITLLLLVGCVSIPTPVPTPELIIVEVTKKEMAKICGLRTQRGCVWHGHKYILKSEEIKSRAEATEDTI